MDVVDLRGDDDVKAAHDARIAKQVIDDLLQFAVGFASFEQRHGDAYRTDCAPAQTTASAPV